MSDLENADEVRPIDFNTIFDLEESTPGRSHSEDKESRAAWQAINRKQWSDIEARYKAGSRDKGTVCAWMAYRAAMALCKGQPSRLSPTGGNDRFNELLIEGYQAAVRRWDAAHATYVDPATAKDAKAMKAIKKATALRYAPAKDTGNDMPGLVYTAVLGRMRNASHELFTVHGKRKHAKDDVLPVVSVVGDIAEITDLWEDTRAHTTAPAYGAEAPSTAASGYIDGTDPDIGSIKDKAINAAADRAARTKSNAVFKWHRQIQAPQSRAEFQSRQAREATELYVHRLLAPLPPKERELIAYAWGVEGVEKATPQKLAALGGCPVSTVYKRLGKLYVEIAGQV
jgi:hypothetical protein